MTDTPVQETTTMRRLKRSRTLQVTSLMATASFSLAACGAPQVAAPPPEPALAYTSLDECKAANDISDTECDAGYANATAQAQQTAPRYATQSECEGAWGPDQCRPNSSGGSFFTPLVTGFVIGQLLNGGGYLGRDYRTGRQVANGRDYGTDVARQAPSRVQSRTTVVSRGGFGGGGRGFGG